MKPSDVALYLISASRWSFGQGKPHSSLSLLSDPALVCQEPYDELKHGAGPKAKVLGSDGLDPLNGAMHRASSGDELAWFLADRQSCRFTAEIIRTFRLGLMETC